MRHWNTVHSADHSRVDQTMHLSLPDGTYLVSEFNYSMPRTLRGYATVGYKTQNRDGIGQSDPRLKRTFRHNPENDKGYYSDHTYESPMCERGQIGISGTVGYHKVNQGTIEPKAQSNEINSFDKNGDPSVMATSGRLTFPRSNAPNNTGTHLFATWMPWRVYCISNGLPNFYIIVFLYRRSTLSGIQFCNRIHIIQYRALCAIAMKNKYRISNIFLMQSKYIL